ncbi:dTDP-glucose 4,6-dehydratase [Evansella clarkii]|uniref:dTDP-glucose 4,6-dehydratase n=1 Tax=Evansella clarkii TaxID=79879 RepID=UPI000B4424B9|nr:dTDP-glucose 4,6-dehydratase [Evansella clarkii]
MKILITGGAGFIGSNFVRYMLNKYSEYKIINIDKLTYAGNLENLEGVIDNPNHCFVQGDISDRDLINSLLKKHSPDAVINFAAESHVDRSIEEPDVFVKTNIVGTHTLLHASLQNNVKRFVQISTDEVYGSLGEDGYFTEETPLAPNSPYSASKASADLLVKSYFETYNMHVNITRCSNNYGPFHFPEKLIPLMVTNALEDRELPVYGDGLHVRDWLHVEDHCRAIDLVLHQGRPGEIYNIGGHNEKKNNDIVKEILNYLKKPGTLIKYVEDRKGHDRRYAIDAEKIKSELGWTPHFSFNEGLMKTIEWYMNNRQWWERLKTVKLYSKL